MAWGLPGFTCTDFATAYHWSRRPRLTTSSILCLWSAMAPLRRLSRDGHSGATNLGLARDWRLVGPKSAVVDLGAQRGNPESMLTGLGLWIPGSPLRGAPE